MRGDFEAAMLQVEEALEREKEAVRVHTELDQKFQQLADRLGIRDGDRRLFRDWPNSTKARLLI